MKLLVVEDDPLIQRSLCEMLEAWGHVCDEAGDGETAWELIRCWPYDLILLDLNLPRLDGLTLCRRIRARGGPQPLILMLTARDTNHDRVLGLDDGADDYMVKPFDPDLLRARVQALLAAAGATCSKDHLLEAAWNWAETPGSDSLRTHVKNLRAKLSAAGGPPNLVDTVYGVGFRLHPDHAA